MANKHTVVGGESLASIAEAEGFNWKTLWDHPDNAKLKERRKSPLGILVGDEVAIPEKSVATISVKGGDAFTFVKRSNRPQLKLAVKFDGKAVAKAPFELAVGDEKIKGETTDAGDVVATVPVDARTAELRVTPKDDSVPPLHYKLSLGALDQPEKDAGVQQRLQLAGFFTGPADGKLAGDSALALRDFQRERPGLNETGKPDDPTVTALGEETALA